LYIVSLSMYFDIWVSRNT